MKKTNHGGAGRNQGRKPTDPAKKKHTVSVCITAAALERIDCRAYAMGRSRSEVVQRWAERLPIL
jgi:hypothetical protein